MPVFETARATVQLTLDCDHRCTFCAQAGLAGNPASAEEVETALKQLRADTNEVTLVGGEPTTAPTFFQALAAARDLGYDRIGVQTHGAALAEPDVAERARELGLTDVLVSIHGAKAEVHDYHTGVDGSFTTLRRALRACRSTGLPVAATTVLTRSNYRVLAAMPPLLAGEGIVGWSVAIPHVAGRAHLDRTVPRLSLAMPFVLHAVDLARRSRLPAWVEGAPLCLTGPHAALARPGETRAYAAPCSDCGARSRCSGVDPVYLERWGGGELRAREEASPVSTDAGGVHRMFVGTGTRAPATRAPRSLPVTR